MDNIPKKDIIGLIIAGGRSSRFKGINKIFVELENKPLIEHVIERLAPQVGEIVINSNTAVEQLKKYNYRIVSDSIADFAGPLAGIQVGLQAWPEKYHVVISADTPFIPADLVEQLQTAVTQNQCAYASDGTQHALVLLCPPYFINAVSQILKEGKRSLRSLLSAHGRSVILEPTSEANIMININTPEDLTLAKNWWKKAH